MTATFDLSELWDPAVRRNPHEFYDRVRDTGRPVLQIDPAGNRFWVVAGYADVLTGLRHPAIGHEVHRHCPDMQQQAQHHLPEVARIEARQLISLDPPDHTRLRGLVSGGFTARAVARLEPWIGDLADRLVAEARRWGRIDGVTHLADPVPVNVIAELVGIPEPDRPRFRAWSAAIVSAGPDGPEATLEFAAYLDELAARRRAVPEDDLISELVARADQDEQLDRDELVALVQLLLIAGQETTVDLIVNGIRLLLTHPEQWQAVREDPSLSAAVVEETLRFRGPVEIVPPRFAFQDIELGGGRIPAFDRVGLSLWGANRDPAVFDRPHAFDIHRSDVRRHIAFGYGIHFCLGAHLARLESRIMFERIARQLPGPRLAADPDELDSFRLHQNGLPLQV
ncbi:MULTISPECIES: cytochrome P450 [Micromonospora]|uniref:Cytochrome P450 n=1 Tax=Micromonospora sicca TaxID=2202420 RepID=A0A317DLY7_9ACTN|nr:MULTISPECIES: cytochrome P450 [unclassified Micromonospora]MBM0224544.1 cytochrome P450 [Micromonospora sp. ATA51]PWR15382.1 cytochrome P450 [Micromonospora sp. 4G51]